MAGRRRVPAGSEIASAEPLPLHGAVALAGVVDLARAHALGLSADATGDFLGGSPEEVPDRYAAASPRALLPLGVPQLLVHGTADDSVPFELSEGYVEAARAAGDEATLLALPGTGHFEVIDPLSREWPEILAAIRELVEGNADSISARGVGMEIGWRLKPRLGAIRHETGRGYRSRRVLQGRGQRKRLTGARRGRRMEEKKARFCDSGRVYRVVS